MDLQQQLSEAASEGNLAKCEALILKNVDVNWKYSEWVLHYTM